MAKPKKWGKPFDWFAAALQRYGWFDSAEAAYQALQGRAIRGWRGNPDAFKRRWIAVPPDRHVAFHRLVMAYGLGRGLGPGEHVHHVDGDPANNHPANLKLCSLAEHHLEHGFIGLQSQSGTVLLVRGRQNRRSLARVVMETFLGRKLGSQERVMHRNGDFRDNRPSNLEVITLQELGRRMGRRYGGSWKAQRRQGGSWEGRPSYGEQGGLAGS